jgi:NTP pyrophosphatase (non-canonical NTP hydrolase)
MSHFDRIRYWAHERNLITGATQQAQMLKLTEEVGELAAGIARGSELQVMDGIGDCVVVLTILAAQQGVEIEECIAQAWDQIKDRKGRMENGIFIKEAA